MKMQNQLNIALDDAAGWARHYRETGQYPPAGAVINWQVTVYDPEENQIAKWTIEGRTQQEAAAEAEADIFYITDADDWTLVPA